MSRITESVVPITMNGIRLPHGVFTLSEIDPQLFKRILAKIGEDKVLFATDSPWRDIEEEAKLLRSLRLGETAEQKIFRDNAMELLGLGK